MNLPKAGASQDISADNSQFEITNRSAEEIGALNTKAKTYAVPISQTRKTTRVSSQERRRAVESSQYLSSAED